MDGIPEQKLGYIHKSASRWFFAQFKFNLKETLENIEGAIKNGQSVETDNIVNTRHKTKTNKTKTQHNCVGHHFTQTNTNNVNKTWVLLQTIGGKDEQNIVFYRNC